MRLPPMTIALGSQSWPIRPLTVAQVQAVEPLLFASADGKAGSVAAAVAILRVALARDHAEAVAGLDELEATAGDIAAATSQVLRLGGFLPDGDRAPGEAGAGQPPAADQPVTSRSAPIGAGSTPA